jgi:hypothetical protein
MLGPQVLYPPFPLFGQGADFRTDFDGFEDADTISYSRVFYN